MGAALGSIEADKAHALDHGTDARPYGVAVDHRDDADGQSIGSAGRKGERQDEGRRDRGRLCQEIGRPKRQTAASTSGEGIRDLGARTVGVLAARSVSRAVHEKPQAEHSRASPVVVVDAPHARQREPEPVR